MGFSKEISIKALKSFPDEQMALEWLVDN